MRISVLIPTYGRRRDLLRTLEAYARQTPGPSFEVVVVDDGSEDGSLDAVAARRYPFPLRLARQENAGPAKARNRALELARGELVLYTGDDIEPEPDLLRQHLLGHAEAADPRIAILGLTRWPEHGPLTATMRHIDGPGAQQFSYTFFEDGAEYDFRHLYTSNVSIHRSLLDREPGGFATVFPAAAFEDAEFGHRLAFHGLRIRYRAAAVAEHHHPYRAGGFYRRQVRCGQMAALLFRRNPELSKWLGVKELQHRRLALLNDPVAAGFPETKRRAIAVAESFEQSGAPGLDDFLRPLFHLGYVEGLAKSLFGEAAGTRVAAALGFEELPKAARRLRKRLVDGGWPARRSDLEALAGDDDD
ncbi:MAG: glycosyltransferase family 2 protein [Acidobacteriota bacterium]